MSSYWTHKSRPQYIRLTPVSDWTHKTRPRSITLTPLSDWQQNIQPEGFKKRYHGNWRNGPSVMSNWLLVMAAHTWL